MQLDSTRPSFGLSCWVGEPEPMQVAHRHDDVELNVADRDLQYLLNGARMTILAGRAGIFWASRPHQLIEVPLHTSVTWLTVPLHEFLSWSLPDGFVAGLMHGKLLVPDIGPEIAGGRFAHWQDDLSSDSAFAIHTSRLEIQAFFRRISIAPDISSVPPRFSSTGPIETVALMAAFIAAHFTESITVEDVSAVAHVHPSHAMALFKRTTGVSIGRYLAQCRVAEAQRLLIGSTMPMADVACGAGFGSMSQFYERFSSACRMTPTAYRRQNVAFGPAAAT